MAPRQLQAKAGSCSGCDIAAQLWGDAAQLWEVKSQCAESKSEGGLGNNILCRFAQWLDLLWGMPKTARTIFL